MTVKTERQWQTPPASENTGVEKACLEAIRAMSGLSRLLEARLKIQQGYSQGQAEANEALLELERARSALARIDGTFLEVNDLLSSSMEE